MGARNGDAKSVDVTAPAGGVLDGEFRRLSNFNGFVFGDHPAGASFALDRDKDGAFDLILPAGLNPTKGAILYIPPAGAGVADLTLTAAGNIPALQVLEPKDGIGRALVCLV